jgi:hypothetical protein
MAARSTAFLVPQFKEQLSEAEDIASTAEASSHFVYAKRLFVYEAAYLLAFSAWENILEQSFVRLLAGYRNSIGVTALAPGIARPPTVADAVLLVLNGKSYKLWHSPASVIARAQGFFLPNGPHEAVLTSALVDIGDFAAIRHYVAHRSADSRAKFLVAAHRLSGVGLLGTRAGRFLRSQTTDPVSGQAMTWLQRICGDLERYAVQIAG